jgi:hypothetical protein
VRTVKSRLRPKPTVGRAEAGPRPTEGNRPPALEIFQDPQIGKLEYIVVDEITKQIVTTEEIKTKINPARDDEEELFSLYQ